MGLLDYFKVKSSDEKEDDSSTAIKLPNHNHNNNMNQSEDVHRIHDSEDDEDDGYGVYDEEIDEVKEICKIDEKILKDPKQFMEILQVVRDSVLDYFALHELVELQLSCKYFNEMVDLFIVTRSAVWWSACWRRTFNYMYGSEAVNNRIRFGSIHSHTENTSTFNHFYASSLSIEEEMKLFPFVLEGSEEEVALVKEEEEKAAAQLKLRRYNPRELQGKFIGKETQHESFKITKSKVTKLMRKSGLLTQFISMSYSSTGKSGSANGNFDKQFLIKKVKRNYFEEQQRSKGQSKLVKLANSSLRFIFWSIFDKWWLKNKSKEEKLIAHTSTINRKRLASYDRYGPVNRTETVELFSLVHQVEGKPDTIIGTYVKHHSYYA